MSIDLNQVPTPCYVAEEEKLKKNRGVFDYVQQQSGATILLALKGFAMYSAFPLLRPVLKGVSASSLNEALLGAEEFKGEVHLYSPAYREDEFEELMENSSHIIFNSFSQWKRYKDKVLAHPKKIECGLRINPEYSEIETPLYDPCYKHSRLGITLEEFREGELEGISGLHFHCHCANNSDTLERTLRNVEGKFGSALHKMKWVNFGGGHHISRPDYNVEFLIRLIRDFRKKYDVDVILEPGEAIALNAGVFVTSVLDLIHNEMDIAMLDCSTSTHLPDVIEMPYRPVCFGAGEAGEFPHTYRLAGSTCLAGDVIGDYSFSEPLQVGDKLVFGDMLHYTMVKTTTFNGINLPSIAIWSDEKKELRVIRRFGYDDYKSRLS